MITKLNNFENVNNFREYIREYNIRHFWKYRDYGDAISKHNRKFYRIRKENHNKSVLEDVIYDKKRDVLSLMFRVTPTYKGGEKEVTAIDLKGNEVKKLYYTLLIEFQEIKSIIGRNVEWHRLSKMEKRSFVRDLIKYGDVKFHSNDPSYLYQGTWKIMFDLDSSIYKFPKGLIDKGIWAKRHGNGGIHMTKHFINVFNTILKQENVTKIIRGMDDTYTVQRIHKKKNIET